MKTAELMNGTNDAVTSMINVLSIVQITVGMLIFMIFLFSIVRYSENPNKHTPSDCFRPLMYCLLLFSPNIIMAINDNIFKDESMSSQYSESVAKISHEVKPYTAIETKPIPIKKEKNKEPSKPFDWTFLKYTGIVIGVVWVLGVIGYLSYLVLLITKYKINLNASKKYLKLDESFGTVVTYLEPLKKQVETNKLIISKIPNIGKNLDYINNILLEKEFKYNSVVEHYQRFM